jgi:hypothetical protein
MQINYCRNATETEKELLERMPKEMYSSYKKYVYKSKGSDKGTPPTQ